MRTGALPLVVVEGDGEGVGEELLDEGERVGRRRQAFSVEVGGRTRPAWIRRIREVDCGVGREARMRWVKDRGFRGEGLGE